jgi:HEAT repeat protein
MKSAIAVITFSVVTATFLSAATNTTVNQGTSTMREMILNQDFSTAQKALQENTKQKNVQAVCLSLKHHSLLIRRQAADALRSIQHKSAVKCLIEALEDNQVVYFGGTETQIEQDELNESIVLTLKSLTGLDLPAKPKFSAAEIKQVIQKSKEWWSVNKNSIK